MIVLLVILEYLCGSMMFSYWLAKLANKDLTQVGDGNPGAFNLWKAAGYKLGLLGTALDVLKGYFPLVLFLKYGLVEDIYVIPVALAAILGHVFPVFLKFRGGKAIAVTFGVWSALTGFEVSFAYAIILAVLKLIAKLVTQSWASPTEVDAFMVVLGMGITGIYMLMRNFEGYLIILWICSLFILAYTNKAKLYRLANQITQEEQWRDLLGRFRQNRMQ